MDGRLRNMAGIYITCEDKMLLLYRISSRVVRTPSWCNIGGHFEEFELNDAKACALREMSEETGIQATNLKNIRMRYITLRNINGEIRQNYYFFADLINHDQKLQDCDEGILEWVSLDKVLERDMPYTAKEVLKHYFSIGQFNNKLYTAAVASNHTVFTELSEF